VDDYIFHGLLVFVKSFFKTCIILHRIITAEVLDVADTLFDSLIALVQVVNGSSESDRRHRRRCYQAIEALQSAGFIGQGSSCDEETVEEILREAEEVESTTSTPAECYTPVMTLSLTEYIEARNVLGINKSLQHLLKVMISDKSAKSLRQKEFNELG
jgi:hypothetical protein